MSSMLEAKRATRGLRMAALVGQAADDDEQFWNNDVWNEEGSDAESFRSEDEDAKPDEFDSDFNDSETEEESGSDEEGKTQRTARAQKVKQTKASNVYKDPTSSSGVRAPIKRRVEYDNDVVLKRKSVNQSLQYAGPLERAVRDSTKAKTQTTDEADKIRSSIQARALKTKLSVDRPIRTEFKQKDLLLEALDTEENNGKWLVAQSLVELERAQADKPLKVSSSESYIRFSSRRGTYNTVTFSMVEAMPSILNGSGEDQMPPSSQFCVITGLPAKYRDPRTLLPYATVDAFREIRRRHPNPAPGLARR